MCVWKNNIWQHLLEIIGTKLCENIDLRRAISMPIICNTNSTFLDLVSEHEFCHSGNLEKLDIIWQPLIKR